MSPEIRFCFFFSFLFFQLDLFLKTVEGRIPNQKVVTKEISCCNEDSLNSSAGAS